MRIAPVADTHLAARSARWGSATGHRFELEQPAGLAQHDLFDHPETYPGIAKIKAARQAASAG